MTKHMLDASLPQPCNHLALKADPAAWAALPLVGVQRVEGAEDIEIRTCAACGSSLGRPVEPSAKQRLFDLFSAVRLAGCGALTLHEDMTAGAVDALQAWAAIDGLEIETLAVRTPPMAVLTIRFGNEHYVKVFAALGAAS
jgi:hypothetical protein